MGFCVTRDGPQISSVMRDGAKISRVMRDFLFYNSVTRDLPIRFRNKWYFFDPEDYHSKWNIV